MSYMSYLVVHGAKIGQDILNNIECLNIPSHLTLSTLSRYSVVTLRISYFELVKIKDFILDGPIPPPSPLIRSSQ